MGIKKIAARLKEILGSDSHSEKKQAETIQKLLGKLEKKQIRLGQKLDEATEIGEKMKLERKLERCSKQLAKGRKALKKLG